MTPDLDAIRDHLEKYAGAIGPGGEKAWCAGVLAADVPDLLAEIERLTEDSTTLNTIAFRIADALGDVPPGADSIEADPVDLAQRLIAIAEEHRNAAIALDVAQAALHRIHERSDMTPSMRTITEHALRAERWDDTVPPGGWVCAIDGTPVESEPCPQHGHTGAPWCCDTCRAGLKDMPSADGTPWGFQP